MKKRLPIKGWQWQARIKSMRLKQYIIVHGNAERVAFGRAAKHLGIRWASLAIGGKIWCWIISKKGAKK